jgi:hypothetical protein
LPPGAEDEEDEEEEEEEGDEEEMSSYEKERLANIKRNNEFLLNLGIDQIQVLRREGYRLGVEGGRWRVVG